MSLPLISVICPTANRPEMMLRTVKNFMAQDYPNKELIILDDSIEPQSHTYLGCYIHGARNIRYEYDGPKRKCIAKKRNMLCEMASGDIIAHMDDDDESSPNRLSAQAVMLLDGSYEITGYHTILFYRDSDGTVYKWFNSIRAAAGASLMYTKKIWNKYRFNEMQIVGSDNTFLDKCHRQGISDNGSNMLVAHIHKAGSNPRQVEIDPFYSKLDPSALPNWFGSWNKAAA